MCLSPATIIVFNRKALKKFGGFGGDANGIRNRSDLENLSEYAEYAADMYGWDDIQKYCLAAYQIVKLHPFADGNKRTAGYVLLNCLRKKGLYYTGREKDLAEEIIRLAQTDPSKKEESVLNFSYFIKSRLQKRQIS
jgi:death-on-curing protein